MGMMISDFPDRCENETVPPSEVFDKLCSPSLLSETFCNGHVAPVSVTPFAVSMAIQENTEPRGNSKVREALPFKETPNAFRKRKVAEILAAAMILPTPYKK